MLIRTKISYIAQFSKTWNLFSFPHRSDFPSDTNLVYLNKIFSCYSIDQIKLLKSIDVGKPSQRLLHIWCLVHEKKILKGIFLAFDVQREEPLWLPIEIMGIEGYSIRINFPLTCLTQLYLSMHPLRAIVCWVFNTNFLAWIFSAFNGT